MKIPNAFIHLPFIKEETMKDVMLVIHELGLVFLLGASLFFIISKSSLLETFNKDASKFAKISATYRKMMYIGFVLMILSGGYLMTPFWSSFALMGTVHVKVTIIVSWLLIMAILGIRAKSIKTKSPEKYFPSLIVMHYINLALGLMVIIAATLSFH